MAGLSIGRAWDEASRLLVSQRRLLVPIALAFLFVPSALSGLAAPSARGTSPGDAVSVVSLIAVLLGFVGQLAINLVAIGRKGQLGELLKRAARRLLPLIAALLIVAAPIALLFLGAGKLLPAPGASPASVPLGQAALGLALLIALLVLVLIAGARLIFPLVPTAAAEDGGPIALLKRSWQLSRGHFWKLLALVMLVGIASLVLLGAVQSVVGSIATLALGKPDPWSVSRLVVALAGALVQSVVATVGSVLSARVYIQLAATKA